MLFSSFGRNVMNMILLALAAQFAAAFVTSLPAGFLLVALSIIAWGRPHRRSHPVLGQVAAAVALMTIVPALAGSVFLFTRLGSRGRLQPLRIVDPLTKQGIPGWGALFWRTCLKAVGFALGMAIFALLVGFLIPDIRGNGMACGHALGGGDSTCGAYRFRRSTAAAVTALVRQGWRPPDYRVRAAATINANTVHLSCRVNALCQIVGVRWTGENVQLGIVPRPWGLFTASASAFSAVYCFAVFGPPPRSRCW